MKRARSGPIWLLLLGCTAALPRPDAADAARAQAIWPEMTLAELERGRELYVETCSSCHTLKLPSELPPERWRGEVADMRKIGVEVSDADAELITRFLETLSRREGG